MPGGFAVFRALSAVSRALFDRSGATSIEYALIATLISIAIIGAATLVGASLDETYRAIPDSFPD